MLVMWVAKVSVLSSVNLHLAFPSNIKMFCSAYICVSWCEKLKTGLFLLWSSACCKLTMQRMLVRFSLVSQRVQHIRSLSVTVCNLSDSPNTDSDRTTHFGFETVTEAEKGRKGLLLWIIEMCTCTLACNYKAALSHVCIVLHCLVVSWRTRSLFVIRRTR